VLSLLSSVLCPPLAVLPLAHLVHTPHPFLIRFSENFGIRYYGLGYLLGFVGAYWLMRRYHRAGRSPMAPTVVLDLMTYMVMGVMVGGRLGWFLFYHPEDLFNPPWAFFQVWNGGMASHGGFIGVIVAAWLFARSRKLPFFQVTDVIATTVPVGLGIVRIANYLNGELWGKVTDVPWGVIFQATGGGSLPRHPSQLYEAALEGAVLLAFVQWRFWRTTAANLQPGRISGEFLIGYALARIICELFREPDAALILGLSRGTFYSVFVAVGGVVVAAIASRRSGRSPD
jgi:phosphatidylglycerol---prolipoprotein diacylglyceryl transferase